MEPTPKTTQTRLIKSLPGAWIGASTSKYLLTPEPQGLRFSCAMDRESALEAIYEDEHSGCDRYFSDVDMIDADQDGEHEQLEDGELKESPASVDGVFQSSVQKAARPLDTENDLDKAINNAKHATRNRRYKKKNHRKSKNKSNSIASINCFVIDTCKRLREPKSYLVWEAVRNLGVFVIRNLLDEVFTIESSGGQLTADGKRRRTAGGILWNVLKSREPEAYKQIMLKGKEFEKQLRKENTKWPAKDLDCQPNIKRSRMGSYDSGRNSLKSAKDDQSQDGLPSAKDEQFQDSFPEDIWQAPPVKAWVDGIKAANASTENRDTDELDIQDVQLLQKSRTPVRDRLRVPVEYDDLIVENTTERSVREREERGHLQDAM